MEEICNVYRFVPGCWSYWALYFSHIDQETLPSVITSSTLLSKARFSKKRRCLNSTYAIGKHVYVVLPCFVALHFAAHRAFWERAAGGRRSGRRLRAVSCGCAVALCAAWNAAHILVLIRGRRWRRSAAPAGDARVPRAPAVKTEWRNR